MTASGDLTDFTEPAESPNLIGPKPQDECLERRVCDKKGDRYIAIDCKSLKKKNHQECGLFMIIVAKSEVKQR